MLLKELIKCTPSKHPDKRPLKLALTKLTKVLEENQSTQEDIDNIQKVMKIQNMVGLKLVEADRFVILVLPATMTIHSCYNNLLLLLIQNTKGDLFEKGNCWSIIQRKNALRTFRCFCLIIF